MIDTKRKTEMTLKSINEIAGEIN